MKRYNWTDKDLQKLFKNINKKCFDNQLPEIAIFFSPAVKKNDGGGFIIFKDKTICITIIDDFKKLSKDFIFHTLIHEMVHYYLYLIDENPDHTIKFYDALLNCYREYIDVEEAWRIILVSMQDIGIMLKRKKRLKIKIEEVKS